MVQNVVPIRLCPGRREPPKHQAILARSPVDASHLRTGTDHGFRNSNRAIAAATLVVTFAFGILPYASSRRKDSPPASRPASRLSVHVSQRVSQTHTRIENRSTQQTGQDLLLGYAGAVVLAVALCWSYRTYVLGAVGVLLVVTGLATWATRPWTVTIGAGRRGGLLAVIAFLLISADVLVLVFPGLPWGSGLRFGWTLGQGAHLHGPGFVGGSLVLVLATAISLLLLAAGALAVALYRSGDRASDMRRATCYSGADRLAGVGLRRSTLRIAAGVALFGLVFAFGLAHFNPMSLPLHLTVSANR
jgi:hypothetical protein